MYRPVITEKCFFLSPLKWFSPITFLTRRNSHSSYMTTLFTWRQIWSSQLYAWSQVCTSSLWPLTIAYSIGPLPLIIMTRNTLCNHYHSYQYWISLLIWYSKSKPKVTFTYALFALVLVNTLQINEKFNLFGKPTLVNLGNQFVWFMLRSKKDFKETRGPCA